MIIVVKEHVHAPRPWKIERTIVHGEGQMLRDTWDPCPHHWGPVTETKTNPWTNRDYESFRDDVRVCKLCGHTQTRRQLSHFRDDMQCYVYSWDEWEDAAPEEPVC